MARALHSVPDVPLECLECEVASRRVVVPLDRVARLIEFQRSPVPPEAAPWVGGFGREGDVVFLSISLAGVGEAGIRRGLLMSTAGSLGWALEVDRVRGVVQAEATAQTACGPFDCPDGWLRSARIGEDDVILLDAGAVGRDISGAAR